MNKTVQHRQANRKIANVPLVCMLDTSIRDEPLLREQSYSQTEAHPHLYNSQPNETCPGRGLRLKTLSFVEDPDKRLLKKYCKMDSKIQVKYRRAGTPTSDWGSRPARMGSSKTARKVAASPMTPGLVKFTIRLKGGHDPAPPLTVHGRRGVGHASTSSLLTMA